MKYRMIVIVMVISLMLVGGAYGEWSQVISVVSRISTGTLDGGISYKSDEAGWDVAVDEKDWHDTYTVVVKRRNVPSKKINEKVIVKDKITFKNEGSIPAKFQNFSVEHVSVSATVDITTTTQEEKYADDGTSFVPSQYKDIVTVTQSKVILSDESSAEFLDFGIDNMSDVMLSAGDKKRFGVNESLKSGVRDALKDKANLSDNETMKIINYTWTYSYECELKLFNVN